MPWISGDADLQISAELVIEKLNLEPLIPEGGYFRQTYKSKDNILIDDTERSASTMIYYLITRDLFSSLHRLIRDEAWHFYFGDPVEMVIIYKNGTSEEIMLGNNLLSDQVPQQIVHKGNWFGGKLSSVNEGAYGFALLGATVAPGFEYADFESGDRDELILEYPQLSDLIIEYTYASVNTEEKNEL